MSKVQIKVLKTTLNDELAEKYGHEKSLCPILKEGQAFETTGPFDNAMPDGFCHMAWQSLFMPVNVLSSGGKVLGIDEKHVACCADGIRPVIFELSRKED